MVSYDDDYSHVEERVEQCSYEREHENLTPNQADQNNSRLNQKKDIDVINEYIFCTRLSISQ